MDVAPATDFDFTFPSYTSAPSSPTQLTELYCVFDEMLIAAEANCDRSLPTIPFAWEEKPGVLVFLKHPPTYLKKTIFHLISASDGRAMDKDPLKKYSANFRKHDQDIRYVSKRRGRISAHELHYNVNRAVSNDMKKKTFLPYKQGILGTFSF
ncbi:hypothetical protein L1987_53353 [Smallanthus sonchifolius]|uniref:Uncharacterized protein n=1 Tax=Smallanthus sonchifolius TaxID=185202 RepID=A0ACB9EWU4_9ASTR|nr:hypothetical protein L1987_53353 [Smallanthus sonchifolius]